MAYIKRRLSSYKWPVRIEEPSDNGVFDVSTFTLEFKCLDQPTIESYKNNRDLLDAAVIGWGDDYVDEAGKPVPYSEQEKKYLLGLPCFLRAAGKAFFASLSGAPEGN
jgi:hypothetical protein